VVAISKKKERGQSKNWRGVFNFNHQVIIKYLHAYSKAQAKVFMLRRIAAEQEVSYGAVYSMFDGSKDNYTIEEEK
jgi:hypothetical protein